MLGIRGCDSRNYCTCNCRWYFRDAAVDAKNTAEIELARNRVEMMQVCVNSQSLFTKHFKTCSQHFLQIDDNTTTIADKNTICHIMTVIN